MNGYKCQMIYKMPDDQFEMPDTDIEAYAILPQQAILCRIHSVPFPIDCRQNMTGRVSSASRRGAARLDSLAPTPLTRRQFDTIPLHCPKLTPQYLGTC